MAYQWKLINVMEVYCFRELLEVLNWVAREERLPSSVTEVTIIVLLKEGKDPLRVASYSPISLLCMDVKIWANVLAARLNRTIQKLIHPEQSGFKPDRSTSVNIRRVFLNPQIPVVNEGSRAILSLDAVKAFDSLEWYYLWRVLTEFQFGPTFINWIKILYETSRAKVRVNNECSEKFRGGRDRGVLYHRCSSPSQWNHWL